jgi:hypothetical protein
MKDIDKVKNKIKKLFALSKSPNANEAALALEMAQKLMVEHGIKQNEVGEFEVMEERVKGNGGKKPPQYEVYLIKSIADSFGCRCAYGVVKRIPKNLHGFDYYDFKYGHIFVGLEHRVKIANFISDIILRKIKKARTEYMKKLNRVRIRGIKIKRADEFCLGWAYTVVSKLHEFTNTLDEQMAIDNYVTNQGWGDGLKTISRGVIKSSSVNDFMNGRRAASDIQIMHGVESRKTSILLLEGNQ